jgi:hypothetical protein
MIKNLLSWTIYDFVDSPMPESAYRIGKTNLVIIGRTLMLEACGESDHSRKNNPTLTRITSSFTIVPLK